MPSPRRASAALFVALAAVTTDPADRLSARQSQVPSERHAGPSVDFIALDADGAPITDLQSSDVEVRIADRVRVVRTLRRVSAAPQPIAAATPRVSPPYGTNDDVAVGRRFVVIIDQESFVTGREHLFRGAIEGLLGQLTPSDRTMVAALPFGGVMVPFTSDIARIRLAAGRVTGQGSRSETGSDLACRTRRFLESLEGTLKNRGTQATPETLVIFTAGLASPRRDAPMGLAPGMCELVTDQFRHVATAASAARANVYVMQPADVGLGSALPRPTIAGDLGSDNPLEGIEHLAGVTGGARLSLDATGTGSLLRVARETSAYYVAEVEPARGEVFGRSRPLSVSVTRRGVTVRTRPEITLAEPEKGGTLRLVVTDLLASSEALSEVRLRVDGFTVRDADGQLRLGVIVEPADRSTTLDSVGAILIDGDVIIGRWFAKDASERPLLGAMAATPGRYRLRVVAIDSTGRAGTAETAIDAGLTSVGSLSLGSLMLGLARDGNIAPRLEFASELTAIASFDIYGGAAGMALSARVEVARELDGPAIAAVPVALARADDARVVATGTVPVGALPPGDYVVRGLVRLENGETGRVVRTLRKAAR